MAALARAWLATNADPELTIRSLGRIAESCDDPYAAYGMMAEAYRRKKPPDTAGLLEALRQQIARAPAFAGPHTINPTVTTIARAMLCEFISHSPGSG